MVKIKALLEKAWKKNVVQTTVNSLNEKLFELKKIEPKSDKFSFFVEKNYDGVKVSIHKKENSVLVFYNGVDFTSKFPLTLYDRIVSLADANFILDAIFVPKNENLFGKTLASDFFNEKIQVLDSYCFYAFDCSYYGRSLEQLELYGRKKILHSLDFNDVIMESGSIEVNSFSEAKKTIELFDKADLSNGAILRKSNSIYFLEEDDKDYLELYSVPFGGGILEENKD